MNLFLLIRPRAITRPSTIASKNDIKVNSMVIPTPLTKKGKYLATTLKSNRAAPSLANLLPLRAPRVHRRVRLCRPGVSGSALAPCLTLAVVPTVAAITCCYSPGFSRPGTYLVPKYFSYSSSYLPLALIVARPLLISSCISLSCLRMAIP